MNFQFEGPLLKFSYQIRRFSNFSISSSPTNFYLFLAQWRWRRSNARTHRRKLHSQSTRLVRWRGKRNHVPLPGVNALRCPRYLAIPQRLALGPPAHPSSRQFSAKRWSYLRYWPDFYIHSGTGARPHCPLAEDIMRGQHVGMGTIEHHQGHYGQQAVATQQQQPVMWPPPFLI